MNLRKNIITALLIAIGYILHQIIPGAIGGMKFDLMLTVIFVSLMINQEFKNVLLTAFLGGVITALTTTFPGGQLPNIIDKLITCISIFFIMKATSKLKNPLFSVGIVAFIGTIISGTVFLTSAFIIAGLPAPFTALFMGIVLPTAVTNIFVTLLVYKAVSISLKVSGIKYIEQ